MKSNTHHALYRIFVDHPAHGWIPVGHWYKDREIARGWKSFVRAAWNCRVKVVHAATMLEKSEVTP